jgi:hypothetical protein
MRSREVGYPTSWPTLADFSKFIGIPVFIMGKLPRTHVADGILPRHSLAVLLLRLARPLLPRRWRPSFFRRGERVEEDLIIRTGDGIFMTTRTWEAFRKDTRMLKLNDGRVL